MSDRFPHLSAPEVYGSFQSGLKAIEQNLPDLIILDMTLPTFDRKPNARDGRARPLGGYELMRKMSLKSINSKVIVVTQLESFGDGDDEVSFNDLINICARDFPKIFIGGVYFDQAGLEWEVALYEKIKNLEGL
ncbi:hypothetical protein [Xanthomonas sacchari]|uniref:hypothetical protein n=1 Tax=Xanthomonas sacchari TaxID=56458 RepID=UPI00224F111C|nr:hypothetical protein [Xanthomonas sacchari]